MSKKSIFHVLGRGPVHPFPARMAADVALRAIDRTAKRLTVLDPMMGSGTVLALARANGHRAVGFDMDPLAVLLSRVWTTSIDPDATLTVASRVLAKAKGGFSRVSVRDAYPAGADDETRAFIRYWFDPYVRRQLSALSSRIARVRDDTIRDTLWCALSRLIIAKAAGASRAMDLAHSRPHRAYERGPVKPFDRFLQAVASVVANSPHRGSYGLGPTAAVSQGDARRMRLRSGSVDLVVTSPPYLNAIDYLRCSKFSLVWMGHSIAELRQVRTSSVGSEAGSSDAASSPLVQSVVAQLAVESRLSNRSMAVLARYVWDMNDAVGEVARVLKPGGKAIYVVGESNSRGAFIRNSQIVIAAARSHGLQLESRKARAIPANRRYLPPPTPSNRAANLGARLAREVVLSFCKA